jgi:hypothetical protein
MTPKAVLICLIFSISNLFAQQYTQTVKGVVSDKNLMNKVPGVLVIINSDTNYSAFTDENGRFEIQNRIPVWIENFIKLDISKQRCFCRPRMIELYSQFYYLEQNNLLKNICHFQMKLHFHLNL